MHRLFFMITTIVMNTSATPGDIYQCTPAALFYIGFGYLLVS